MRRTADVRGDVALTDPRADVAAHTAEIREAMERVVCSGWYVLGDEVAAFESEFAGYTGSTSAVGVANGTDALQIGMRALGIGHGDAVVTVAHTALATVAAVVLTGAIPVLVDVTPADGLIDPAAVEAVLSAIDRGDGPVPAGTVKAVLAVHLYGTTADLAALQQSTQSRGIHLIEDCAQSPGAVAANARCGSVGIFGAFSFYPTKNLSALGDGGALVTSNPEIASFAKQIRQYGWREGQRSERVGINSRLDELQAAVLRCKLPHLDAANARRRAIALRYRAAFATTSLDLPRAPGTDDVVHQFVVRSTDRDDLRESLGAEGVQTGVHYPLPVHRQRAYGDLCRIQAGGLPETEAWADSCLSLPAHPWLTDTELDRVIDAVLRWDLRAA